MTDLSKFLLARISEDEAMAEAAREEGARRYGDRDPHVDSVFFDDGWLTMSVPRMLAEVEAKRQIVTLHREATMDVPGSPHLVDVYCWECGNHLGGFPCPTLRLLAAPYADHPDHLPDWRPEGNPS